MNFSKYILVYSHVSFSPFEKPFASFARNMEHF